jgi:hypothetical protein
MRRGGYGSAVKAGMRPASLALLKAAVVASFTLVAALIVIAVMLSLI